MAEETGNKGKKPKKKGLFGRIWGWTTRNPIIAIILLFVLAVVLLFVTYEVLHATSNPKFCKLCHPQEGTGVLSEYHTWSQNIHAYNEVECLDCHSKQPGLFGYMRAKVEDGLYDLVMEFVLSDEKKVEKLSEFAGNPERIDNSVKGAVICMHCHSDSVNQANREAYRMTVAGISMRGLDTVRNPEFRQVNNMIDIEIDSVRAGVNVDHGLHLVLDVTCAQCHEGVSHSGMFISSLDMQTCFDCHDEQREQGAAPVENYDCETCHQTQVQVQTANVGWGPVAAEILEWSTEYSADEPMSSMEWAMWGIGCESCHEDPFVAPTGEVCLACHEEGYDEFIELFQEGFDDYADAALEFLKENMPERARMSVEKREVFNEYENIYKIITKDGSRGFHNTDFIMFMFEKLDELRERFEETV